MGSRCRDASLGVGRTGAGVWRRSCTRSTCFRESDESLKRGRLMAVQNAERPIVSGEDVETRLVIPIGQR